MLKAVVNELVTELIESEETTGRPILYFDLEQAPLLDLTDVRNWFALYNERVTQVTHPEAVLALFPKVELSRSATADDRLLTDWIRQLDKNKVTIAVDNINESQWAGLRALHVKSQHMLRDSTMVFVKSYKPQEEPDLTIPYLTKTETEEFARQHPPLNDIQDLFDQTHGNPLYLNWLSQPTLADLRNTYRQAGRPLNGLFSQPVIAQLFRSVALQIEDRYAQADRQAAIMSVCALAMLPNGISEDLCQYYLTDWSSLQELTGTGLLTSVQRYGKPWIVMPAFTKAHLPDQYKQIVKESAEGFIDQFQRKAQQSIGEAVQQIIYIQGGHRFLLDLVTLLAQSIREGETNYLILLESILIQAHKPLFAQWRWDEAYQLWHAGIIPLPPEQFEATHWILYARAAFHSGRHRQTAAYLSYIQDISMTLINQIDYLNLKAMYLKDQGDRSREGEIDQCYTDALVQLDEATRQTVQPGAFEDPEDRWAVLHYNRAIFRWWWQHNRETALDDLAKARDSYTALGDDYMLNVIRMEEADMMLDTANTSDLQQSVRTALLKTRQYFAESDLAGDLAMCQYRLGRFFKRQPSPDHNIRQNNLEKALGYYKLAAEGHDLRLRLIAQKHQFVIQSIMLKTLPWPEATLKLTSVADQLGELQAEGDIWSARVLRDLWWFMAQPATDPAQRLYYLKQAMTVAISSPLNPENGTDQGRAVAIFWDICQHYQDQKQWVDLDAFLAGPVHNWIGQWFGKDIYSQEDFSDDFVVVIASKINKPDKYYG